MAQESTRHGNNCRGYSYIIKHKKGKAMIESQGKRYFSPREISDQALITNSKGKGDYNYVLNLIKEGRIPAVIVNEGKQVPYYMVAEDAIKDFNDTRFKRQTV